MGNTIKKKKLKQGKRIEKRMAKCSTGQDGHRGYQCVELRRILPQLKKVLVNNSSKSCLATGT